MKDRPIGANGGWQPPISLFFSRCSPRTPSGTETFLQSMAGVGNLTNKEGASSSRHPALNPCEGCPHLVLRRMGDSDEECEVEAILDIEKRSNTTQFFVKWKGWSSYHNSWVPERDMDHCMSLVLNYCIQNNRHCKYKYTLMRQALKAACNRDQPDIMILSKLTHYKVPTNGAVSKGDIYEMRRKVLDFTELKDKSLLRKLAETFGSWSEFVEIVEKRKEQAEVITKWADDINEKSGEVPRLFVENHVDLECPPENFIYIKDFRPGNGIKFPEDPMVGCECHDCFDNKDGCCPKRANASYMYNRSGRLVANQGTAIFECNRRCKCNEDCSNRVVQKGRQVPLTIFRTTNRRGWGVRTERRIKKGTFLFEYLGEVITSEEAERRGRNYEEQGMTYLFDLDYDDSDGIPYTVDAGAYGNVSHFVNHSCESNMSVYSVWINNLDLDMPRLAFFANRDICCHEELTFDYQIKLASDPEDIRAGGEGGRTPMSSPTAQKSRKRIRIPCLCGTESCRKFLH